MKKKMLIGAAVALGIAAIGVGGFFLYARSQVMTYQNFGFSLTYPKDMTVEEQGAPDFEQVATKEAGKLLFNKPGASLLISWMPAREANREALIQFIGDYLAEQKRAVGFQQSTPTELDQTFFQGKVYELTQEEYDILATRFGTVTKEGFWLNFVGAWHVQESQQIMLVGTAVKIDKHPGFVYSTNYQGLNWPEYKRDPSVKLLSLVVNSFKHEPTQ